MNATLPNDVVFTPAVKAAQEKRGSRAMYARMESDGQFPDTVDQRLADSRRCGLDRIAGAEVEHLLALRQQPRTGLLEGQHGIGRQLAQTVVHGLVRGLSGANAPVAPQ